jgi:hypothetical protein
MQRTWNQRHMGSPVLRAGCLTYHGAKLEKSSTTVIETIIYNASFNKPN